MITYKLNLTGDCANRIVDGVPTGEWHSTKTSKVFHNDLAKGAELQDVEGNTLSQEDAKEFIKTLP